MSFSYIHSLNGNPDAKQHCCCQVLVGIMIGTNRCYKIIVAMFTLIYSNKLTNKNKKIKIEFSLTDYNVLTTTYVIMHKHKAQNKKVCCSQKPRFSVQTQKASNLVQSMHVYMTTSTCCQQSRAYLVKLKVAQNVY